MKRNLIFLVMTILTSCTGYRSQWDCPVGKGVPCTSLTEIESMIVESEDGPNVFLGSETNRPAECNRGLKLQPKVQRVWMTSKQDPFGNYLEGFYMYIDAETCSK